MLSTEIESDEGQPKLSIIAKISNCSDYVEVITCLKSSGQTYKAYFQQSMLTSELVTVSPQRPSNGTTITINNYLSSFPSLQKKELNSKNNLKEVNKLIEYFSLIYPGISFSISDCLTDSPVSIVQTKKQYNSKKAANHIFGNSHHKLVAFHSSSTHYKIKGLLGKNKENLKIRHFTFINSRFFESVEINDVIDSVFLRIFPAINWYYTIVLHIKVNICNEYKVSN
jgi:DNA mismatch repair ATPase MutL